MDELRPVPTDGIFTCGTPAIPGTTSGGHSYVVVFEYPTGRSVQLRVNTEVDAPKGVDESRVEPTCQGVDQGSLKASLTSEQLREFVSASSN